MKLKSWNRFNVTDLAVVPALMGRTMSFTHRGVSVAITIPPLSRVGEHPDRNALASRGSYHAITDETFYFHIHSVDVSTECAPDIELPDGVLNQPNNAFGLIPKSQQQELEELAERSGELALSAFDRWVSILRWITGFHAIGREVRTGSESGWSTRLRDEATGKTVWAESITFSVGTTNRITIDHWDLVEMHLVAGDEPPMHFILLSESRHNADLGDLRRAIVDVSVACEVYLRSSVLGALPSGILAEAVMQIENANINQFVSHMFPALLTDEAKKEYKRSVKDELSSLFNRRNKLMHMAAMGDLTHERCMQYQKAVEALFGLARR